MVEIDDAMRRALLAREGPPRGARELVLAGVRRRVGEGGGSDPDDDPDADADPGSEGLDVDVAGGASGGVTSPAGASATWWAKVAAATLTTTATGLVALRLVVVGVRALQGETVESDARVEEQPVALERDTLPEPPHDEPASEPSPTALAAPELAAPRAQPRAASEPSPTASDDASLTEELALVATAKRLRHEQPKAALEQLELHHERFPAGALAPERELLRIEIRCELGDVQAAERLRERFVVEHPDSPLLARVRGGCRERGTEAAAGGDESSR